MDVVAIIVFFMKMNVRKVIMIKLIMIKIIVIMTGKRFFSIAMA